MTDVTPEEINRRIATWLGVEPIRMCGDDPGLDQECLDGSYDPSECSFLRYGGKWEDCSEKKLVYLDYYRSNAAMDLLGVLVERGYKPELSYHNLNWWHKFSLPGYKQPEYYAIKPTIPAAICTAIMELIEREGR